MASCPQVPVTATDGKFTASASVRVTVRRDLDNPVFTARAGFVNIEENIAVGTTVYTYTATDNDLEVKLIMIVA